MARRAATAALFLCLAAATAHGAQPKPLGGFTARLEDKFEALSDDRVRWSTEWVLCWKAQPKALAYEIQVSTSEGFSREAKRLDATCHRVEVARDEGPRSDMASRRQMQVAMIGTMVGYRIRAVLPSDARGPWSRVFPAGELIGKR